MSDCNECGGANLAMLPCTKCHSGMVGATLERYEDKGRKFGKTVLYSETKKAVLGPEIYKVMAKVGKAASKAGEVMRNSIQDGTNGVFDLSRKMHRIAYAGQWDTKEMSQAKLSQVSGYKLPSIKQLTEDMHKPAIDMAIDDVSAGFSLADSLDNAINLQRAAVASRHSFEALRRMRDNVASSADSGKFARVNAAVARINSEHDEPDVDDWRDWDIREEWGHHGEFKAAETALLYIHKMDNDSWSSLLTGYPGILKKDLFKSSYDRCQALEHISTWAEENYPDGSESAPEIPQETRDAPADVIPKDDTEEIRADIAAKDCDTVSIHFKRGDLTQGSFKLAMDHAVDAIKQRARGVVDLVIDSSEVEAMGNGD